MNKRSFFAILSALVVSAGTLGGFSSCNLSKANGNLPAVKDSTALFDYFTYKGNDDFYKENPLPDDESFHIDQLGRTAKNMPHLFPVY